MLLDELTDIFLKHGSDIHKFNLPSRTIDDSNAPFVDNRFIREEMSYDVVSLAREAPVMFRSLNADQVAAYKMIVDCVQAGEPGFFLCFWVWRYWENLPLEFNMCLS